jgi:beta-galactosidase
MWNDVKYTPGEVIAVAYRDGKEAERALIRTAGKAYRILLSAYRSSIAADGESLNYITAKIVDKDGNLCPHATDRLTFSAEGAAFVYATDAGDQRETETFLRPDKRALSGMLVCTLRSSGERGSVTVSCSGDGLLSGTLTFDCI